LAKISHKQLQMVPSKWKFGTMYCTNILPMITIYSIAFVMNSQSSTYMPQSSG